MLTRRVQAVALTCAATVLLVVRSASAQAPSDAASAEVLFDEARKLMVDHRYADACPKFAESNHLDAGLGTTLFLGACYEKTGATASAWAAFRDAVDLAHRQGDAREAIARDHLDELARKLFQVTISVSAEAGVIPDLEIRRDGVVVARAAWGAEVPVDPGPHTVTAEAPNRKPWQSSFEAKPTGGATSIVVPRLEPAPQADLAPHAPPRSEEHPGRTRRLVGSIVGGVGVAAGATLGTVYGLNAKAENDLSNANGLCGATTCRDAHGVDLRHQALADARISTTAFIAGAAVLAGGVVLVLTALPGGALRAGIASRSAWLEATW